jgi:hypothetical protein
MSYQAYFPFVASPPVGNSNNVPRWPAPSSSASSFNYEHPRPPSPTSITGLLPSPESQPLGWSPIPHSNNPSFNNREYVDSQSYPISPENFESGYDGHEGYRQEKNQHILARAPRWQLLKLLGNSALRWILTAALSALYTFTLYHYGAKDIMNEPEKRRFNTWTTALSIAMGLNIASSFKEMALNLRWWILSRSKRNLNEVDLILRCDSLTSLVKFVLKVRTPLSILFCLLWLLLNILAQVGIAMLSLTYGIEPDPNTALQFPGNVSIPDMSSFIPGMNASYNPSLTDQAYTAHTYGMITLNYGADITGNTPEAGKTVETTNASLWLTDPHTWEFIFFDSPPSGYGPASIFTDRTINATWSCQASPIISGGDGTQFQFAVQNHGLHNVSLALPNSTVFFTNYLQNSCTDSSNARCAVVNVFEASDTQPWFYRCEITIGEVQNARSDVPAQHFSDQMAWIAGAAIAIEGYMADVPDSLKQEAQLYPDDSFWGYPMHGDADGMGKWIALFALGSIAGAAYNNPLAFF